MVSQLSEKLGVDLDAGRMVSFEKEMLLLVDETALHSFLVFIVVLHAYHELVHLSLNFLNVEV